MHALSVSGLTKTYKNGVKALKGIDLTVEEGDQAQPHEDDRGDPDPSHEGGERHQLLEAQEVPGPLDDGTQPVVEARREQEREAGTHEQNGNEGRRSRPDAARMLDDDAIARYARQIVVPGIGASLSPSGIFSY